METMFSTKMNPFVFIISIFFFTLTFISLSHGAPQYHGSMISNNMRRQLLEAPNNTSLILAAERTRRKDPLNGFNYYDGGWDISEKNYYSSVGFTAVPLFTIALTWFIGFGLSLLVIALCHCCSQNRQQRRQYSNHSKFAFWISLVYVVLFTVASIIGCIVLYLGQERFHNESTRTLDYVVQQADSVAKSLANVSQSLDEAKNVEIDQIFLPQTVSRSIDHVVSQINGSSVILEKVTHDNSRGIRHVFNIVGLTLVIVSAVMLLLAFLGFLFSLLGKQRLVYILVVVGWILVTGTFILAATFLILHNVVGDTCVAMDEWVKNPTQKSALDEILPCVDQSTAQQTLGEVKSVTSQLVGVANFFITNISNVNATSQLPIYYNQSGPPVPILCDPFYSDPAKSDRNCSDGEVNFDNAQMEWTKFVCHVSESGICTTMGRLSPVYFNQLVAISKLGSTLYNYGPFLVGLRDCSFVRKTFTNISREHCNGLWHNSRLIVIGLVLASASLMFSLIFWIFFAKENRHRGHYTKQVQDQSS